MPPTHKFDGTLASVTSSDLKKVKVKQKFQFIRTLISKKHISLLEKLLNSYSELYLPFYIDTNVNIIRKNILCSFLGNFLLKECHRHINSKQLWRV